MEQSGGRVLVHCQAGISRSPSIVLAYLIDRKNMDFDDAYHLLTERRPIVAPNFNFLAQLNDFSTECCSRRSSSGANSLCSSGDYEEARPFAASTSSDGKKYIALPMPPKRCRSGIVELSPENNDSYLL